MARQWTRQRAEELYERYAGLVRDRAMRILDDEEDAREITQEAFARLLRTYDPEDAAETPAALLIKITTNLSLNLIRNASSRREKLRQHRDARPGAGDGPPGHDSIERTELIRSLLERVSPDIQRLVVNYYIDDMTKEEIARLHSLSVPTVRKRLDVFVRRSRSSLTREMVQALLVCLAVAMILSNAAGR